MSRQEKAELYAFYNERLKGLGIGEEVETMTQLSQIQRVGAALAGVGAPVVAFWLMGRSRMKAE